MSGGNRHRLKCGSEGMSGVLNQLNWRNDTQFVQLSGILPVEQNLLSQGKVIDFSSTTGTSDKVRMCQSCDGLP